jgi:hypothetical protein
VFDLESLPPCGRVLARLSGDMKKRPTAADLSPMPRPTRQSRPWVHNRAAVVVIGVLLLTVAAAVAIWLLQQHRGGGTYGK